MKQVRKEFYRYTSLSVLGMLGMAGTILADTFFVSDKLGAQGLAALNIAICIFGLINGLGLLFGIGGATCYTIAHARGQKGRANEAFSTAMWLSAITGVILWAAGMFFSREIVTLLGASGEILPMAEIYMRTILCFAPFFILRHVYVSFLRNDGAPRLAMAAMLLGSLANIVLDYFFIYPMNMGIFGAALATALTPVLSILLCLPHLLGKKIGFHMARRCLRWVEIRRILGFGSAAFVNEFSSGIVLVVFNLLVLRYAGNMGVAAYGIVANLALVVMAVYTGMSQGVQPLLSRAYGLGDMAQVRQVSRHSILVSTVLGALVVAGSFAFTTELVAIFNQEHIAQLQAIAESGLRIYFVSFLFLGANFTMTSLFSATERSHCGFVLSFFRGCAGIIVTAVVLAMMWGLDGVWLSIPAVEAVTVLLGMYFWKRSFSPERAKELKGELSAV